MRLKTSRWFETVVRYERQSEKCRSEESDREPMLWSVRPSEMQRKTITREMQTFVKRRVCCEECHTCGVWRNLLQRQCRGRQLV